MHPTVKPATTATNPTPPEQPRLYRDAHTDGDTHHHRTATHDPSNRQSATSACVATTVALQGFAPDVIGKRAKQCERTSSCRGRVIV